MAIKKRKFKKSQPYRGKSKKSKLKKQTKRPRTQKKVKLVRAKTCSVLSLGTRKDAKYWAEESNSQLGYQIGLKIAEPQPTLDMIKSVFARSDDWLFLGGHFDSANHLYNEAGNIKIRFSSSHVKVTHNGTTTTLNKGVEFNQHKKIKALFWGGCSVHTSSTIIRALRSLFGNPVMIGWKGTTGWQILYSVMGGYGNDSPHAKEDFFQLVVSGDTDARNIRQAWLTPAFKTTWGAPTDGGPAYTERFSVIGPSGQEWILGDEGIKKGNHYG